MGEPWRDFLSTLTPREREVFKLIGQGLKNTEISAKMGIKLNTTRTYAKRIHDKLYIEGRTNLAIAAYRLSAEGAGENHSDVRRDFHGGAKTCGNRARNT